MDLNILSSELTDALPQEKSEIGSHYKMRLAVFKRACEDGH
jgi:hypothetical protein